MPKLYRGYEITITSLKDWNVEALVANPKEPGITVSFIGLGTIRALEQATTFIDTILEKEPKIMPEVERPRTYGDLMEYVKANRIDQEEYFSLSQGVKAEEPIWSPTTVWIAVYWVEGGSEGYYVHVDRIEDREALGHRVSTVMACGKFWAKASASLAVTYLTPFVYGLNPI